MPSSRSSPPTTSSTDEAVFVASCKAALKAARQGYIMTLGVRPQHPATGYGYIKPGDPIASTEAYRVGRFVEKPDRETAAGYIAQGFLWNSGNFLFPADAMIEELDELQPAILSAARAAVERATPDLDFIRLHEESFSSAPRMSIDHAVMETDAKGRRAAGLLHLVGHRHLELAVGSSRPHDEAGNALRGNVEVMGSTNSLVQSDDILTTVVGLDDVVVVAKADAVLVTSRQKSDLVKDLVARMRDKSRPEADEHLRIYRPWGWYQRIDAGSRFQVKRIMVKPGGRLSLQKHFHRAEHWVVVRGTAEVTVDRLVSTIHENELVYIPIGATHRLVNPGRIALELIEVQVGSYTGEDDIVRLEDAYGR